MGTHFKIHLKKYQRLIGLVLLGVMFWGARSLWDSSEARYGQVAFERLASENGPVPALTSKSAIPGVAISHHAWPITKSRRMPALEESTAYPVKKAGTEKYAVPASAHPDSAQRRGRHRAMSRRERIATLLLILAQGRH